MDPKLQAVCDRIVSERQALKKEMRGEMASNTCAIMAALISAAAGKEITPDRYRECKALLKHSVGAFSEFRGIARPMVISKMALQSDPEGYLAGCVEIYSRLRSLHKLTASPYMVMAAMTLYEHGGTAKAEENVEKLELLFKSLKREHPLLITDEDRGYLAMLIAFGQDPEAVARETESCFEACSLLMAGRNTRHSVAQVLALSPRPAGQKAHGVWELFEGLKKAGKPIQRANCLAALGALELLELSAEQKIRLISEADDYLAAHKGFKWYNDGPRVRRMYAALAVLTAFSGEENAVIAANVSGTMTMVLIETLITMMIITAVNASSSAASSSHG